MTSPSIAEKREPDANDSRKAWMPKDPTAENGKVPVKGVDRWNPFNTCPQGQYVLFKFDGPFADAECPGIACGKLTSNSEVWLTAIWAAGVAHDKPVAWMSLPE